MKTYYCLVLLLLLLLFLLENKLVDTTAKMEELPTCLSHTMYSGVEGVEFRMRNGVTFGFTSDGLNKGNLMVQNGSSAFAVKIQQCAAEDFCLNCKGQGVYPLRSRRTFSLVFEESTLRLGEGEGALLCERLPVRFPTQLRIGFKLMRNFASNFKFMFRFNCTDECWMQNDISLQMSPEGSFEKDFYFKARGPGAEARFSVVNNVTLNSEFWWKTVKVQLEKQKSDGSKILSIREDGQLVSVEELNYVPSKLLFRSFSSSEVIWTEGCLPDHEVLEGRQPQLSSMKTRDGDQMNKEEGSYLGTGLSKGMLIQILFFSACIIVTAAIAVICTLCISRKKNKNRNSTLESLSSKKDKLSPQNVYEQTSFVRAKGSVENKSYLELKSMGVEKSETELNEEINIYEDEKDYIETVPSGYSRSATLSRISNPTRDSLSKIYSSGRNMGAEETIHVHGMQETRNDHEEPNPIIPSQDPEFYYTVDYEDENGYMEMSQLASPSYTVQSHLLHHKKGETELKYSEKVYESLGSLLAEETNIDGHLKNQQEVV